ncbi:MAG: histidinol dehydrogenase [Planctomycetota bacterium]
MNIELDNILLSDKDSDFERKLIELRKSIIQAAAFTPGDEKYSQLMNILRAVAKEGDCRIAEFTEKFDGVKLTPDQFRVRPDELEKAHSRMDKALLGSIRQAIENVRRYQKEVFIGNSKTCSGGTGIKYTPIRRVGICVPGASAPLPSTVIMTAVPAQVAGVKQIAVISPPRHNGSIHPVILATCHEIGITEVYRIGGAQAVAAFAVGTQTIPKVDKIVGPGNAWVQTAKKHYFGFVDIDSIAGPSEVLILATEDADPAWVAADMLSQAEHDPASALVFTDSRAVALAVLEELRNQLRALRRAKETAQCLSRYSGIVLFSSFEKAIEWANEFAPEHLQIQCGSKSDAIVEKIKNAGAIFVGPFSPVATGDYWAGPSHTLPTGMSAKFFSALSANDFVKSSSIIRYDKDMLLNAADHIIRLAEAEGLDAHAKSVQIRRAD